MLKGFITAAMLAGIPLPCLAQSTLRFEVVLSQTSEPAGIIASLVTDATYPCEGYTVRTGVTQTFDTLAVHIKGIMRPVPCFTMFGRASGTAFLGPTLDGIRFIRFSYQERVDIYSITTRNSSTSIWPVRASFTDLTSRLP